ncbi:hypothetical protein AO057_00010 [Curvibacter sp. PAE-UM]|nr:hypothetical protein AO057_00010 [Curvibacter sp. PAE-UM]
MRGYAIYVLLIAAGFGVWALLFWFQRRSSGRGQKLVGWVTIGPLHAYLERRGYRLSRRELLGWGLVALVMVAAPLASWWLER